MEHQNRANPSDFKDETSQEVLSNFPTNGRTSDHPETDVALKYESMDYTNRPGTDFTVDTSQSNLNTTPKNSRTSTSLDSDHWDKGWAWFVVIGSTICNLIVFGSLRSAGIILNEVTAKFEVSSTRASLIVIFNVSCTIVWSEFVLISSTH